MSNGNSTAPGLGSANADAMASESPAPRPSPEHTHRPIEDIYHDLQLNPFERVMLWLSKTDPYALGAATYHTHLTLQALGMFVLGTGVLAWVSAFFALRVSLEAEGANIMIAGFAATLYAFLIMMIDREIASSQSKASLLVRLPFAILMGLVISFPIENMLLKGRIEAEIDKIVEQRNAQKIDRITEIGQFGLKARAEERESQLRTLASLDLEIAALDKDIDDEIRQRGGCEKRCKDKQANKAQKEEKKDKQFQKLQALAKPIELPPDLTREKGALERHIDEDRKKSTDFLSRLEALTSINRESPESAVATWLLRLFFMALELAPALIKLTLAETEYHRYIEARRRLNISKSTAISNYWIREMNEQPERVFDAPHEITDAIIAHTEDSMVAVRGGEAEAIRRARRTVVQAARAPSPTPVPDAPPGRDG